MRAVVTGWLRAGCIGLAGVMFLAGCGEASSTASQATDVPPATDVPVPTDTPQPPAAGLTADGKYAPTEAVGLPTTVTLNISNTGGDIPHLMLLTYDFAKTWVVNGVSRSDGGSCTDIGEHNYDCGPMTAGNSATVTFDLNPLAPGNYTPNIGFATNIDSSTGLVDPNSMLDHPSLQMDVAVNP